MTPEQFAYWMQGFVELTKGQEPTAEQWKSIREHLDTVFKKVTPPVVDVAKKPAEIDWGKIWRELDKQPAPKFPQQTPPGYPWPPSQQPYWLQPGHGFPPGTIIC